MSRIRSIFRLFEELTAGTLLVLLCLIVATQVFSRYVLGNPFIWAEELARTLFIWTSFLGAVVALKQKRHFAIELLANRMASMNYKWKISAAWIEWSVVVIVFLLLLTLTWSGVSYAIAIMETRTEILEISRAWNYMALPASTLLMMIRITPDLMRIPGRTSASQ
jgi:TRAP-type C4-dicarboxylate transport system permease small subunit